MTKIYLGIFTLLLLFGFVTFFKQGNSLKKTTNNEALTVQSLTESKGIIGTKTQINTNEMSGLPLGTIAPLPVEYTNTVSKNTSVETTKQTSGRVQSGVLANQYSNVAACECTCPYAGKIVILGKGSTAASPEMRWFQENVRGSTIYSLDGGLGARINQIKAQIKKLQGEMCPKQKILIIGYSLGASIAKNLKTEFPCVDILTIDPPDTNWCNFFMARWVSPALRQICTSNGSGLGADVDWTNGNAGDTANHYPWDKPNTPANVQKLKDLKAKLDSATCTP